MRSAEARFDYTAAVMQATENAHAGRHPNHQRHNAHAAPAPAPAAPIPNPPAAQQDVINFQQEAEKQQWQQLQREAQYVERQEAERGAVVQLQAQQAQRQAAEEWQCV
ncbi:hypothetical protein PAXRUDRAFT_22107 [Paxillus rubicundulus Ve08.2h10]|uniref:Uncharacterized protein n=1 Tax=Paxillus rubicundulus Ve08.2h10 TaxID=930991 RepID=A0A0D0BKZ6_9AGAM|nr:hypothetical protein PAXRUDRAFT_22107 [Paxillus rubicundulus Ve08.2h10]